MSKRFVDLSDHLVPPRRFVSSYRLNADFKAWSSMEPPKDLDEVIILIWLCNDEVANVGGEVPLVPFLLEYAPMNL